MAPSRNQLAHGQTAVKAPGADLSSLPTWFRFPLFVATSWSLSIILYTVVSQFAIGDLARVSRSVNGWFEILSYAAIKVIPLATGWYNRLDAYDLAAVTYLAKFPTLFLVGTFYGIHPTTWILSLGIDVLSVLVPLLFLRSLSAAHSGSAAVRSIVNRRIISDPAVQIYTSLFGAAIYTLVFAAAFNTYFPTWIIGNFDSLYSISLTHDTLMIPKLFLAFVPLGAAAKVFLFTPSTAAKSDLGDIRRKSFNPATASLADTLEHNVWGFSKRVRVLLGRTAFLVMYVTLNTFLQSYFTIEGAEFWGAFGWSGLWALASVGVGAAYWWVADVQEVKN